MNMTFLKPFAVVAMITSLAVFTSACSNEASSEQANIQAVKVIKLSETGNAGYTGSGKVVADEEVQVVSKLSGRIASVNVTEGTVVKKGEVLAQLEANDYSQQLLQAQSAVASANAKLADAKAGTRTQEKQRLSSSVEQAKAAHDVAVKSFERIKALYDTGAVSQSEFEKASLELEKARSAYEQVKAQLDLANEGATTHSLSALQGEVQRLQSGANLAKNSLENTVIKSPIDGIVARRSIDPGEMAQSTTTLFTIVKMDQVKIEASVPQDVVNSVKQGAKVDVTVDSINGKVFQGIVDFVSPISDANSTTFPVKVKVPNQEGMLRAGMIAKVSLQGHEGKTLKVPATAVVQKENKSFVWKVEGEVVHLTEVAVEKENNNWYIVNNGLKEKDEIVIDPTEQLTDGAKVKTE